MISILHLLLGILQLSMCTSSSSTPNNNQFRSNPYEVLHLDPQCDQKDIQRSYRKLCLEHHPDKKRSDVGNSVNTDAKVGNDGGLDDDFEFKEVQHAYSLIGTEEDRRNYDLKRKFN